MSKKALDLTDTRFERLLAVGISHRITGNVIWDCVCDCGKKVKVSSSSLLSKRQRSCGCLSREVHSGPQGAGNIGLTYWNRIQRTAKKSNREFSIDYDYIWDIFQQQKGRCAYAGIPLRIPHNNPNNPGNASLDRIDNNLGYVYGNVQWVDKRINAMKSNLTEDDFVELCRLVTQHREN